MVYMLVYLGVYGVYTCISRCVVYILDVWNHFNDGSYDYVIA